MSGDPSPPAVGDAAPLFGLRSVQGPTVELAAYRGHRNVVLWFSRGFTCPFCRQYMDGIGQGYQELCAVDTEVIQVAPNLLESARTFFRDAPSPFPFVCDPDKRLYAVYGLGDRGALEATRAPEGATADVRLSIQELGAAYLGGVTLAALANAGLVAGDSAAIASLSAAFAWHEMPVSPLSFHPFGFVAGCVWGDDSSWKLQYLDLSRAAEGIVRREERFGYLELPAGRPLAELVDETVAPIVAENRGVYLEIEGHTDSSGPRAYNLQLGEERAEAVRDYLHDQHQIALNRMAVISYGEAKPVEDNKTRVNRAMNRRVVINVLE